MIRVGDLAGRGPLGLKPPRPIRGTPEAKAHMARVAALRCVTCFRPGPSEVHHCISGRHGSRKVSDFQTIPLCFECHRGPTGIHASLRSWERLHGRDTGFLPVVADMLAGELNLGKEARAPPDPSD